MSAGIYEYNGVIAYAMNLEKKLKRRKGAKILETYNGELTGEDLENYLKDLVTEKTTFNTKSVKYEGYKKYKFRNRVTNELIISIYDNLNNIPNLNKEDWELE